MWIVCGGFHQWEYSTNIWWFPEMRVLYPNSWMVYNGKSKQKMDDKPWIEGVSFEYQMK
jgi:hypothetical protein